jgi:hypothetical protein
VTQLRHCTYIHPAFSNHHIKRLFFYLSFRVWESPKVHTNSQQRSFL